MKNKNWIDYLSEYLDSPVFGITVIVIVLFSILLFLIWFAELIIKSLE